VAAYKVAEQLEVEMMRELRVENVEKQQNETDAKHCLCRRGMAGTMLQCALCKDWFHSTCSHSCKFVVPRQIALLKSCLDNLGLFY